MEAAAHGKSNIGIPKKVGQDFAKADTGKKFSTQAMANALRKRKQPAEDPEEEAMQRGGYSRNGGGVGSG
jgi:hypothetical protein